VYTFNPKDKGVFVLNPLDKDDASLRIDGIGDKQFSITYEIDSLKLKAEEFLIETKYQGNLRYINLSECKEIPKDLEASDLSDDDAKVQAALH
jgi:hypothetical protein